MEKNYLILTNLGTPAAPSRTAVCKYLFEFLMDRFVIDLPFPLRLALVGGIIAPFRSKESSAAYASIWSHRGKPGSPLLLLMQELQEKLKQRLVQRNSKTEVLLAMRYGSPSIRSVIKALAAEHQNQPFKKVMLHFIPMYPHYAFSTTVTAVDKIKAEIKRNWAKKNSSEQMLRYRIAPLSYYNEPAYLEALAQQMLPYLKRPWDHLLFSYHGIPERHLTKFAETKAHCLSHPDCCAVKTDRAAAHGKCYQHQVKETTRHLVELLKLKPGSYTLAFQSRLGKSPWLTPYTAQTVQTLAKKGVRKLLVVCPAFTVDNLETLFEIEIENKELFLAAGGESLTLIPCLNTSTKWVEVLLHYAETVGSLG